MDKERRRIKQSARWLIISPRRSMMVYTSRDASQASIDAGVQRMLNGSLKPSRVEEPVRTYVGGRPGLEWRAIWDHSATKIRPALSVGLEASMLDRRWVRSIPSKRLKL